MFGMVSLLEIPLAKAPETAISLRYGWLAFYSETPGEEELGQQVPVAG
jgi:hypothetical protein